MILAIVIGVWFFKLAKYAGLNKGLWAAIGVLAFILGQFFLTYILALIVPQIFDGMMVEMLVGIAGGVLGVVISYIALQNAIKNKPKRSEDSGLIDNEF